jgi:hypothetical protein
MFLSIMPFIKHIIMYRSILLITFGLILASGSSVYAQTVIKEHIVSIDSATGKTTVTTIIKTEEDAIPYTDMINAGPLKFLIAFNLTWIHMLNDHIAGGLGLELGTTQDAWG